MTNKDVIIKVLNEHPCLTAMEVRQFAKRLCISSEGAKRIEKK